jgi:hypothetical protein
MATKLESESASSMRKLAISLFVASVFVLLIPHHAWAGGACDKVGGYFAVLADAARVDPQGANKLMGRTQAYYLARADQARTGGIEERQCAQFVAGVQQNWDMNIQDIFPKLKRVRKPSGSTHGSCGRAFIIIVNFTLKLKSPDIFSVYVWAANTSLVSPLDCQWIVDAYS